MRRGFFVLLLSAIIAACSGKILATTSTQDAGVIEAAPPADDAGARTPVVPDAAHGDAAAADASRPVRDAGDGGICGWATDPISDSCYAEQRCDTCAAYAFVYECSAPSFGRPDIQGCSHMYDVEEHRYWCCPPKCLKTAGGSGCGPNKVYYSCPVEDGGVLGAAPPPNCTEHDAGYPTPDVEYCCDP